MLFAELQPLIVQSSQTVEPRELVRAVGIAVDMAKQLRIPIMASVVKSASQGSLDLIEPLVGHTPMVRTAPGMLDDGGILRVLAGHSRPILAIGGVSSEIAVLHSVLGAIREGCKVHVLVDCCGGLSARTEEAAFRQMESAGAVLSSISSFFTGLASTIDDDVGTPVFAGLGRLWSRGDPDCR